MNKSNDKTREDDAESDNTSVNEIIDDGSEEVDSFLSSFDDIDQDEILKILETEDDEVVSDMEREAGFVSDEFESLLTAAVKDNLSKNHSYDEATMSPRSQLGHEDESASKKVIERMGESNSYPNKPVPTKIEQGELEDTLASILEQIEKDKKEIE